MSHQRELIRNAVVTALTGSTVAGGNVFPTRFLPNRLANLPALAVYTIDETVDPGSLDNTQGTSREFTRNMRLMVEGVIRASGTADNPDNALDDFAVQIERALNVDDTFGGVCGWSIMESTEVHVFEEGQKAFGLIQIVYMVRYYTDAPEASDVTLQPLKTIDVVWGPNGIPGTAGSPTADNLEDKLINLDTLPAYELPDTQNLEEED